jgi:hypothetical protein
LARLASGWKFVPMTRVTKITALCFTVGHQGRACASVTCKLTRCPLFNSNSLSTIIINTRKSKARLQKVTQWLTRKTFCFRHTVRRHGMLDLGISSSCAHLNPLKSETCLNTI